MIDTDTYHQYYEQPGVWQRQKPSELEWSRITETINMIPSCVNSIVDVGCGDGLLTNQLLGKFDKVLGIDISKEALNHVVTEKLQANIDNLPLPGQSYDLAICCEVIEHLPCQVYEKSLLELQRIARDYLLLTVPNEEFLRDRFVKCPQCFCTYHRYRHLRSFDLEEMKKLFPSFEYMKHSYMGGLTVRPYRWDTIWRQNIGDQWNISEHSVCPQCGAAGTGIPNRGFISYLFSILRRLLPQKKKPHWLAVLYRRKRDNAYNI